MAPTLSHLPASPIQPQTQTVYVHLCSGEIQIISPATSVSVEPHLVVVYNGSSAVATYPRGDVYLCSKTPTSPVLT